MPGITREINSIERRWLTLRDLTARIVARQRLGAGRLADRGPCLVTPYLLFDKHMSSPYLSQQCRVLSVELASLRANSANY